MAPDSLMGVAFPVHDDHPICTALNQVARISCSNVGRPYQNRIGLNSIGFLFLLLSRNPMYRVGGSWHEPGHLFRSADGF